MKNNHGSLSFFKFLSFNDRKLQGNSILLPTCSLCDMPMHPYQGFVRHGCHFVWSMLFVIYASFISIHDAVTRLVRLLYEFLNNQPVIYILFISTSLFFSILSGILIWSTPSVVGGNGLLFVPKQNIEAVQQDPSFVRE